MAWSARHDRRLPGVVPAQVSGNVFINIRHLRLKNFKRQVILSEDGTYIKSFLPEGEYLLNCFVDLDDDGKFSPGSLFPFRYAEPFVVHPDTITVRKRWETSAVNIVLPQIREGR